MTKTFLAVASHWSNPGVRQYASNDRFAAETKCIELVNELIGDWAAWVQRGGGDPHGMLVPPPVPGGMRHWESTLRALQLKRLIDYLGGEGEANDALFEFAERKCLGEPPLIGDGLSPALQEIVGEYVAEDDCEPDKIGFPMVWIEEVESAASGSDDRPPADSEDDAALALVLDLALRFAAEGDIADGPSVVVEKNKDGSAAFNAETRAWLREAGCTLSDEQPTPLQVTAAVHRLRTRGLPERTWPRVAVVCSGGIMQSVIGDAAVDVMLVDYDVEKGDAVYPMLEQEGGKPEPASVHIETATVQPEWLDMVEEAVKRAEIEA